MHAITTSLKKGFANCSMYVPLTTNATMGRQLLFTASIIYIILITRTNWYLSICNHLTFLSNIVVKSVLMDTILLLMYD